MKTFKIILTLLAIGAVFSLNLKTKQDTSKTTQPLQPQNSTSSVITGPNGELRTPLTTNEIQTKGKIVTTTEKSIPYGTGYSMSNWQKVNV